jgi:uncharacterized protein (DUF2062 family)
MNDGMRTFGYWLGVALLIAGAAAAVADVVTVVEGAPTTYSLGAIWFRIHSNSLVGFQALIQKSALSWLWPPIQELLILPTWLILVPLGLLLVIACSAGSRRSRA